jgi:hypothetical protein
LCEMTVPGRAATARQPVPGAIATMPYPTPNFGTRRASQLSGVLKCQNLLPDRDWEVDKNEVALVEQIVLAGFIDNAHQAISGSPRIRKYWVYLAKYQ